MKAVILAGGLGMQISEETSTCPKPMVEIGGKPILWHSVQSYRISGEFTNTDKMMNDKFWIGLYLGQVEEMLDFVCEKIEAFFDANFWQWGIICVF
jgi:CTP:phosphocholine cytidylyltransferase-like protein